MVEKCSSEQAFLIQEAYQNTLLEYLKAEHLPVVACLYLGRQLDPAFALMINVALDVSTTIFFSSGGVNEEEFDVAFSASVKSFLRLVQPVVSSVDEATKEILGKKFSDVMILPQQEKIEFFLAVGKKFGFTEDQLMEQMLQQMYPDTKH